MLLQEVAVLLFNSLRSKIWNQAVSCCGTTCHQTTLLWLFAQSHYRIIWSSICDSINQSKWCIVSGGTMCEMRSINKVWLIDMQRSALRHRGTRICFQSPGHALYRRILWHRADSLCSYMDKHQKVRWVIAAYLFSSGKTLLLRVFHHRDTQTQTCCWSSASDRLSRTHAQTHTREPTPEARDLTNGICSDFTVGWSCSVCV